MAFVRNQKIGPEESEKEVGVYTCAACGQVLFEEKYKFSVGSGFPSFWAQAGEQVQHKTLDSYGRHRVQLLCSHCKQHLGHLFEDARTPTKLRYCINAAALKYNV